jgi:eukaryotic-like serine/threonine-protein kinase
MNNVSDTTTPQSGTAGLSTSRGVVRLMIGRRLWVWPLVAAIALAVLGWFTNRAIESALHKHVADELQTILNADVESLRIWIREQEVDAELIVAAAHLVPAVKELTALENGPEAGLRQSPYQARLRERLQPRLKQYGYVGYFLVSHSLRVIAANDDAAIGKSLDGVRAEFFQSVLRGRSAVSKPYRSPLMLVNDRGEAKSGQATILAAAPVLDENGRPIAALGIQIREHEFSKILQIARAGDSGETFAFDKTGLFLSHSRFDDALKRIGLLADLPDSRSILTLELRDPGVNMMAGERPLVNRSEQPLTRMAADAVAGNSGVDVGGYRDYRGVPVIGAWTWLPELDLGVATEIDVAEAYRPLYILRTAFGLLFVLLILSALAIFAFMIVVARQRRRMEKAQQTIKQLGQYTLEEKIGEGGMGTVYRARHAFLRRPTAIKMLRTGATTDDALRRFEREVQLTSRLNHPNTIAIYDYGRTPDGVFYYAMEYLDGKNLEELVKSHGPLPDGRVIQILRQICGSLAEAHAIGLIHRDIKPANVIVSNRAEIPDYVKVLDFGLVKAVDADEEAKITRANVSVGTPYYMSPEAVERPDTITALSDIYAIGAVGYFLLTGGPVFTGKTVMEICMKHVKAVPESPSQRLGREIAAGVEALILRCLAKAPADRPASARSLQEELEVCKPSQQWTRQDAESWWAGCVT